MRLQQYEILEQSVPTAWYAQDIDRVLQKQKDGANSFSDPWRVPARPPEYLLPLIFTPEYEVFRDEMNKQLRYHTLLCYLL